MSSDDSNHLQYDCEVVLNDSDTRLLITVRDKKNLRKFTNSYNVATLAAKGLTQSLDKLSKILKTAAKTKNKKDNWSIIYGYFHNPSKSSKKREEEMDLTPAYLSKTNITQLRNKPKRDDTMFVILEINEDFFSIACQFKLYEIEKPKATKKKQRTASVSKTPTYDIDTEQKVMDMESKIKSLTRDNQVLKRKIEKLESTSGKKQKKMDNEREMRLQANKERFWLKQKLDRLQKAISARLKILGVDFSGVDDITAALDMAFGVIQKLAKELQKKEEGFEECRIKMDEAVKECADYRKNSDRLEATIEKQRAVMHDIRNKLGEREKRLSMVAHERNDTESALTQQLKEVQNELNQKSDDKEKIYDELVDLKAMFKGEMDDKMTEFEDIKNELNKRKAENVALLNENEKFKDESDKLLNANNDLNVKLQADMEEMDDLKHDLETEKNKNVDLIENNKTLKQEIGKLLQDLVNLKQLIQKTFNIESQLKHALQDSGDLIGQMASTEKKEQLRQLIDD